MWKCQNPNCNAQVFVKIPFPMVCFCGWKYFDENTHELHAHPTKPNRIFIGQQFVHIYAKPIESEVPCIYRSDPTELVDKKDCNCGTKDRVTLHHCSLYDKPCGLLHRLKHHKRKEIEGQGGVNCLDCEERMAPSGV